MKLIYPQRYSYSFSDKWNMLLGCRELILKLKDGFHYDLIHYQKNIIDENGICKFKIFDTSGEYNTLKDIDFNHVRAKIAIENYLPIKVIKSDYIEMYNVKAVDMEVKFIKDYFYIISLFFLLLRNQHYEFDRTMEHIVYTEHNGILVYSYIEDFYYKLRAMNFPEYKYDFLSTVYKKIIYGIN